MPHYLIRRCTIAKQGESTLLFDEEGHQILGLKSIKFDLSDGKNPLVRITLEVPVDGVEISSPQQNLFAEEDLREGSRPSSTTDHERA